MRNAIEKQLVGRGFTVKVPPEYLGGQNNKNFINREDNNTGVQLELTTALRKAFFKMEILVQKSYQQRKLDTNNGGIY